MSAVENLLLALALGGLLAHFGTLLAIRLAVRFAFYDLPIGYKGHAAPTPYLGGVGVTAATVATMLVVAGSYDKTLPAAGGAVLLWAVGTLDDRRSVSWLARVGLEALLAVALWQLDLGWELGLGSAVDLLVTVGWIVTVTNAFNLFDNMDGASGTMGLVVAGAVAVLGATQGDTWLAAAGAALAGACLGFLPHNLARPRAKIFLGDGGSLPLGFLVAVLIMIGASGVVAPWQGLIVGLLLVALPALDTCLVIISRRRRGVSFLTGGQDHLTHRTKWLLSSAHWVSIVLGGVQALVSALVIVAVRGGSETIVLLVLAYLALAGLAITLFERRRIEGAAVAAARVPGPTPGRRTRLRPYPSYVLLGAVGLGAGLSPLFGGFYDAGTWVPVGLGVVTVTAIGLIARPMHVGVAGGLALAGLLGIAGWALASALWADSVEQAVVSADRWLVIAVLFAALVLMVRNDARAVWSLACVGAGLLAMALVVVARLLGSDPSTLLLEGRLNEPLGYINGEGALFAMGLLLALGLAEQRRPAPAAAGAAGMALFGGLALLSQSRGTALAIGVTLAVVLAVVPGRLRRLGAILVAGAALAVLGGPLLEVYEAGRGCLLSAAKGHAAGAALLGAAALAGVPWGVLVLLVGRRSAATARLGSGLRRAAPGLAAAAALALVGGGVAASGTIADQADSQLDAFVRIAPEPGSASLESSRSRLLTGSGTRYDYWRVALDVWREQPVAGVGAGSYGISYAQRRRSSEEVRQPHSLPLQLLSEQGLVGLGLLLVVLTGVLLGARRAVRAARRSATARGVIVAGLGVALVWFVQTSVDWLHLFPGITAIALIGIAPLVRSANEATEPDHVTPLGDRRRLALVAATAVVLVLAGALLSRQGLTDVYADRAAEALADDPVKAETEADRALRLDGANIGAYYTQSAARARQGDAAGTLSSLRRAIAEEPRNYVSWALLGDVEARLGRIEAARYAYRRASELNPRNTGLRRLAADPGGGPS